MKENIADFFLHVLPYWGKEHERLIFHPYLHDQNKRLVLMHPCIEQIFFDDDDDDVGEVVFYALSERDFHGRKDILIGDLLKKQPVSSWAMGLQAGVIYIPKEYIGAFFNYLQWMCKRPPHFSGSTLRVDGSTDIATTYFKDSYYFDLEGVAEKDTFRICCRLYPYHNSSWLRTRAEQAPALVIDMESPIPTRTRWHYETDGPIKLI